jgi:phage shock protein PspC (stress-responsive transcriptional regulator)
MTAITEGARRLAWFVALWLAGVTCVGAVAYLIRWWLIG